MDSNHNLTGQPASEQPIRKIILTVCVALFCVAALLGTIDRKGELYTSDAFKRALITFGIARGLNGVISVAQGTEVAVHPAGFGVNFTPGQILDPINDLVEQFSWVMLASSASLGIQKVLLNISSTFAVTLLLVIALGGYLVSVWRPDLVTRQLKKFIASVAIILLFVRFSVPLAALASEGMYHYFLHDQYVESSSKLENTQHSISQLNSEESEMYADKKDESLMEMAKRLVNSASESISINARIDKYQKVAAEATEHAINLIVVFTIQTILFPLLFLWIAYRGLRTAWEKFLTG